MTRDEFKQLTKNLPNVVIAIRKTSGSEEIYYSTSIESLTGYTDEEMEAKPGGHLSIVYEDDFQEVKKNHSEMYSKYNGAPRSFDYRIEKRNGDIIWVREAIQFDDPDLLKQTLIDITEFKTSNTKLQKEKDDINEVNTAKDKFISIVSHDLRAPFTSLLGFTEILLNEPELPEEEKREYLNYINDASHNQLHLINYLLDWSRLQSGKISVEARRIKVKSLISQISSYLSGTLIKKQIKFKMNIPDDLFLVADEKLITQVMTNLISNAAKFTHAGKSITVTADRFKKGMVEVVVSDEGIGISEENKNRIFKLEEKVSTSGTNGEKGTGLGLTLVKEIVEKHGGEIWFYSKLNEGSEFHITVPEAKNLILLVEDDVSTRSLYQRLLSKITPNFEVCEANNGYEAISLISENIPSLVITDHSMPLMNGYQLVEAIREREETKHMPIIVISAQINPELKEKYSALGVEQIVLKPFNKEALSQSITEILE
ncbi:MAG: response regulator [Melioribacteraceae bacterium]|nr:response regulator [Melioribacteraceae bacterium]MCF8263299.1 response regulator [Melioribacteraceae bacterium]MCF8431177.1 response regulator [Melioribacteraceae bacterium]